MLYRLLICFLLVIPFIATFGLTKNKPFILRIVPIVFSAVAIYFYLIKLINLSYDININNYIYTYNITIPLYISILLVLDYIYVKIINKDKINAVSLLFILGAFLIELLLKLLYSVATELSFNDLNELYDGKVGLSLYALNLIIIYLISIYISTNNNAFKGFDKKSKIFTYIILYSISLVVLFLQVILDRTTNSTELDEVNVSFGFVLILLTGAIFVLLSYEVNFAHYELIRQEEAKKRDLNEYYNKQMILNTDELIKLKHDTNNILQIIRFKDEELYKQINEKLGTSTQFHFCDDDLLNKILTLKANECYKNNIKYDFDINVLENIKMSDLDKISLFTNIIDNAIEGSIHSAKRELKIEIYYRDDIINIHIVNSADELVRKKDTIYHGKGKIIVRDIINKYKGSINSIFSNNMYVIRIDIDLLNKD